MDIVVFTGDRQTPNSDDFPQNLTPFPEPTQLIYTPPTAAIHPPDAAARRPVSPPQKLRPIRCSGSSAAGEFPDSARRAGTLAGKGFPSDAGCAGHPVRVDSGTFVEGWETNGVMEDESRFFSDLSSSSDDAVDDSAAKFDGLMGRKRMRKSRRKLEHFLENMVMKVMEKQEQMNMQLIETIEKMEKERIMREEAWRQLEMERHKRDEEERAQETSRSLALISFLQNFFGEEIQTSELISQQRKEGNLVESDAQTGGKCDLSNKRWPEAEVQALITLRTTLDHKFRATGSKGSIWEEISVGMSAMGYSRTAKKCKEKWENINKYFRRLTESGNKRSASGKTCPYFHELDLLYKSGVINPGTGVSITSSGDDARSERDSESS